MRNSKRYRRMVKDKDVSRVINLNMFYKEYHLFLPIIQKYRLYRRRLSEYEFINIPWEAEVELYNVMNRISRVDAWRLLDTRHHPQFDIRHNIRLRGHWTSQRKPINGSKRYSFACLCEKRKNRRKARRIILDELNMMDK